MTDITDQIAALQVTVPAASKSRQASTEEERERRARRLGMPTRSELDAQRKELIFGLIVEAALSGERCPTSIDISMQHDLTNSSVYFSMLARDGRIRIEISGRNWRTVWICDGEHRGKSTQTPARARSRPHMVLGPARP